MNFFCLARVNEVIIKMRGVAIMKFPIKPKILKILCDEKSFIRNNHFIQPVIRIVLLAKSFFGD